MVTPSVAAGEPADELDRWIRQGDYAPAEAYLRGQVADPQAPIVDGPAAQLEFLRRTRREYSLTEAELLDQLRESLPDVTQADIQAWTAADDLQHRVIDGEVRYFRRAANNLPRLNADAKRRRDAAAAERAETTPKKFDLLALIREVYAASERTGAVEVCPVRHHVTYALTVMESCDRVVPGAKVRAWLPFPQEYRQQSQVRLLSSTPEVKKVSPNGSPHRTVYFEETIGDDAKPPKFTVEFEFVTAAYCPDLDPADVKPYDTDSDFYREFTAERLPHIALTSDVRELAAEIVGDETNPLRKALRLFTWVSKNITWIGEMEYGAVPSLSLKGLTMRCGDCGVQNISFVTLCRTVGVPARWQSGFGTKPGEENMHDWAEFYVEPWGRLPVDASYGLQKSDDPKVRDFFCGRMDPYRLIVNLDYGRPLIPPKTSLRSEPTDFQRGEIEIDGRNLYFDDWSYDFDVESTPEK
ncbi:Transglutaminase-like superfamily protein [Botrimarina colliarenosi]|uniref:Transglutaminase-like superfamily protein n=1 Tax=Botrimarina colliarenosi TaxID=2528001 RepID=A0A5C6A5P4_9BACT|nr:transglutaminase-like domain-containing protein [Botrimarina colliarenosi]TWT94766.1 Transglutaminase-like superfamily protein [Botrimarina colliarenosi]